MQRNKFSPKRRGLSMHFNLRINGKIIRFCGDIDACKALFRQLGIV